MIESVTCPSCKRAYAFKPELAGKSVKCKCGSRIQFPNFSTTPEASPTPTCPHCHAPLSADAILCTACGYNSKTGQVLAAATASSARTIAGRPNPTQPTSPPTSRNWFRIGAIAAVILLVAGAGVAALMMSGGSNSAKPQQQSAPVAAADPVQDVTNGRSATPAPAPQGNASGPQQPKPAQPQATNAVRQLVGPKEGTTCIALTTDGKMLATGGADKTLRLWNPETGKELKRIELQALPLDLSLSKDGKQLVSTAQDNTVAVWDTATSNLIKKYAHASAVSHARFAAGGQVVIAAGPDLLVWNSQADNPSQTIETGSPVSRLDISPDGAKAVTAQSEIGMIRVWDITKGEKVAQYRHRSSRFDPQTVSEETRAQLLDIRGVAFMDDQRILVGSGAVGSYIWQWSATEPIRELELAIANMSHWAIAGPLIVSLANGSNNFWCFDTSLQPIHAGSRPGRNGCWATIRVENDDYTSLVTGGEWAALAGGGKWESDGKWVPNNRAKIQVVPLSLMTDAIAVDRKGLDKILQDQKKAADDIAASPRAKLDAAFRAACAESAKPIKTIEGQEKGILAVRFSPDGKLMATAGGDHTVRIYEVGSWKELQKLQAHTDAVTDICFSPDQKRILSCSWDNSAIEWDIAKGSILHRLVSPTHIIRCVYLPDGLHAVTSGFFVEFWDLEHEKETGRGITRLEVRGLYASRGGLVASADHSGTVTLWDPATATSMLEGSFPEPAQDVVIENEKTVWVRADGTFTWDIKSGEKKLVSDPLNLILSHEFKPEQPTREFFRIVFAYYGLFRMEKYPKWNCGAIDAQGRYLVYAVGGGLNAEGFSSWGPGDITILDLKKVEAAIEPANNLRKWDQQNHK